MRSCWYHRSKARRLSCCSSALAAGQPYLRWLCFFARTERQDDVRRLVSACRLLVSTASSTGDNDNMLRMMIGSQCDCCVNWSRAFL